MRQFRALFICNCGNAGWAVLVAFLCRPVAGAFAQSGFSFTTVAYAGEAAAGTSEGVEYLYFGDPEIDANGDVTFSAQLQGGGVTSSDNSGLWESTEGNASLVARTGAQRG